MNERLLSISNLSVAYPTERGVVKALQNINLDLYAGKTLVLLGESGCGKSTLGRAMLGLIPRPGELTHGSIVLNLNTKTDLSGLSEKEWQSIRGKHISMIFQDPFQALNPVLKVGSQITEALQSHRKISFRSARCLAMRMLEQLEFKEPDRVFKSFPFQLSGGMCQRIAIASSLINRARILIADEPTTALDVRVQSVILDLIKNLQRDLGLSLMLITHDVGIASNLADEIAVMYAGKIIEIGKAAQIMKRPAHPYTKALLACAPNDRGTIANALPGHPPDLINTRERCLFLPRCSDPNTRCRKSVSPPFRSVMQNSASNHDYACYNPVTYTKHESAKETDNFDTISVKSFSQFDELAEKKRKPELLKVKQITKVFGSKGLFRRNRKPVRALDNVSFAIPQGEIVGIVGESGSGKTTLARCILALERPDFGAVLLNGKSLQEESAGQLRQFRRIMQPVFQSPRASLNSGRTALELVMEPLNYFKVKSVTERREKAKWLLDMAGIGDGLHGRKPDYLSTGQCQRVSIARALALEPRLLICDEPVSSLDLSVQAQILSLLVRLHEKLNFGMLFISHNILVVRSIAHRTLVMKEGRICETLDSTQGFQSACHPYTQSLLESIPRSA